MKQEHQQLNQELQSIDSAMVESELKRERYRQRYLRTLRSTIFMLITAAAVAVLVATLWLPVLQIYGSSMSPTMEDGDIIFSVKRGEMERGDVIAFYYNNKILVKRVIGKPGDWIDITADGTVYVNSAAVDEPYISEKSDGDPDITLPYQVPDRKLFVMGDHRATSADSRHSVVGCVSQEQIVGKIVLRIWPLSKLGIIE